MMSFKLRIFSWEVVVRRSMWFSMSRERSSSRCILSRIVNSSSSFAKHVAFSSSNSSDSPDPPPFFASFFDMYDPGSLMTSLRKQRIEIYWQDFKETTTPTLLLLQRPIPWCTHMMIPPRNYVPFYGSSWPFNRHAPSLFTLQLIIPSRSRLGHHSELQNVFLSALAIGILQPLSFMEREQRP